MFRFHRLTLSFSRSCNPHDFYQDQVAASRRKLFHRRFLFIFSHPCQNGREGEQTAHNMFFPICSFLQLAHIWWWHSLTFRTIVTISRSTKWMFPVCFQPQGVARQNGAASRLILFRCLIFHLFAKTNRANTLPRSSQSLLCCFYLSQGGWPEQVHQVWN